MVEHVEMFTMLRPYGNYRPFLSLQSIHETDEIPRQETTINLHSTQDGAHTAQQALYR